MPDKIYELWNVKATKKQSVIDNNNNPTNGVPSSHEAKDFDFEQTAYVKDQLLSENAVERANFQSHNTLQRWYEPSADHPKPEVNAKGKKR